MFPELTVAVTLSPLPEWLQARGGHGEGICHSLSVKLNTEENLESTHGTFRKLAEELQRLLLVKKKTKKL